MKKFLEEVVNKITDKKAESDLILSNAKSLSLNTQNGAISSYKVSSSQILGVRIIKDGRVGLSFTESFDPESVDYMIKQALENAETSEPNPHERILEMSGTVIDEVHYPEAEVDVNRKTEMILGVEAKIRELEPRVSAVPHNGFSENEFESYYLSSRGRHTIFKDKSYSIGSSVLLDAQGKKANFSHYDVSHTFEGLKVQHVIDTALFHSRNILEEKVLPSGKYAVRFSEDSLKNLIECFANFYSGKSAMDKMNPWGDKIGEKVISSDLTIIDHPFYKDAFRASKFDSEGVERAPLTLIKDGVLQGLCQNSVTASHFKTKTTAHGARGASSSLGVTGTEFLIQGKNVKPMPRKYLEVIQMDGLYSGANRVTGNFSVAVKGYVWENGKRNLTFGNVTLAGNLIDLLQKVEVIGDEILSSTDSSFFSVPLIFHDLSIAGKG